MRNDSQRISNYFLAGLLCLTGIFFWWIIRPFGPGITGDSLLYIECGDNLFSGKGFTVLGHKANLTFAMDCFPLYPLLLKLFSLYSIAPPAFQVLLFVTFSFFLFKTVFAFSSNTDPLLTLIICFFSFLMPFILVYYNVWTEGLYLILLLAIVFIYHEQRNFTLLLLMLLLLSFTRMVGITVGAAFMLQFVLKKKYVKGVACFFVSVFPVATWALIGSLYGSENSRHLSFHPPSFEMLKAFFLSFGSMISRASFLQIFTGAILFCFPAALIVRSRVMSAPVDRILLFLILLFYVYPLFLFFSISFIDYATPLDERILAPQFLTLLLVCAKVVTSQHAGRRLLNICVICTLAIISFVLHAEDMKSLHENGYGFNSKEYQNLPFISVIKGLAPNDKSERENPDNEFVTYTNLPHDVFRLSGRLCRMLPLKFDIHTNRFNDKYEKEWSQYLEKMKGTPQLIIWIRSGAFEKSFITYEELKNTEGLFTLYDDGLCLIRSGTPSSPTFR